MFLVILGIYLIAIGYVFIGFMLLFYGIVAKKGRKGKKKL